LPSPLGGKSLHKANTGSYREKDDLEGGSPHRYPDLGCSE